MAVVKYDRLTPEWIHVESIHPEQISGTNIYIYIYYIRKNRYWRYIGIARSWNYNPKQFGKRYFFCGGKNHSVESRLSRETPRKIGTDFSEQVWKNDFCWEIFLPKNPWWTLHWRGLNLYCIWCIVPQNRHFWGVRILRAHKFDVTQVWTYLHLKKVEWHFITLPCFAGLPHLH